MTTLKDMVDRIKCEDDAAFAKYAERAGFKGWAYEGGPDENRRVAIIKEKDFPGLRWVDLYVDRGDVKVFKQSGGAFYDTGDPNDHPEGALEWARNSAKQYVQSRKDLIAGKPSLPPGTKRG